ncbi:MAG: cyclic nucleotide-binding domain-containing protein [Leptospiraceae bacterium]|nr:cyclic nucleotide-binding domain-containing protein [Leptospiraceae bacterium]
MPIDTSKVNQKISVLNGQVMFEEGHVTNSLNIIHEGSYSIEKKFGETSLPLVNISGKNLTPGVISLFTTGRYHTSISATKDSLLSTYQVNTSTIKKTIMSKMTLGVMIARTILREIIEITKKANALQSLNAIVEKTLDNFALAYFKVEPSVFQDVDLAHYVYSEDEVISDPAVRLVKKNISDFIESGGILPERPSLNFVEEDHHDLLKRSYNEEIDFDDSEFLFMRKILSVDPNLQTPLYTADITILLQICEKFSSSFDNIVEIIEEIVNSLQTNLQLLVGKEGFLDKYYMVLDLMESGVSDEKPEVLIPILEKFSENIQKILLTYRNLFLKEFSDISENLEIFNQKTKALAEKASGSSVDSLESASQTSAGVDLSAMKKELEGSAQKILAFARLPQEQVKEFNALLLKLKSMKNPLDPDNEARKVRKNITKIYWDVYQTSLFKLLENKGVPKPVEMMLNYGFMDETLLEPAQLVFLYTHKDDSRSSKVPVHVGTEWLKQVYDKNVPTSLDELGQTFFDKVKNDYKDRMFKKESDLPSEIDNGDARLKYEMNAMYQPNVRLTTGNPATFLPILTKHQITLPLDKSVVTKEAIEKAINEIQEIDYTCFNREVVYNDEETGIRKELVQRSITPDFIVVPSLGSKIMMWQDLSILRGSGSKGSKGRIILPLFVNGDLKTLLLEAIAAFRWELTKNILGPDWNNVGIPSITSEYMDYIQFYKKSKDLSIEMKEKISSEFKRFRTDRDKFVNDYLLWIKFESEGVQRLNRIVRNIFYKHIPFQKDIRDKVAKLPAYADIHNRFKNIRTRLHKETENRYKKYTDASGNLHPVLQENLDFYKV